MEDEMDEGQLLYAAEPLRPRFELVSDCMGEYDDTRVTRAEAAAIPFDDAPGSVSVFAARMGGSTFAVGMLEVPFLSAIWKHPARSLEPAREACISALDQMRSQAGADAIVLPLEIDEVDGHISLAVGFKVVDGATRSSIKSQLDAAFVGIEELCGG